MKNFFQRWNIEKEIIEVDSQTNNIWLDNFKMPAVLWKQMVRFSVKTFNIKHCISGLNIWNE